MSRRISDIHPQMSTIVPAQTADPMPPTTIEAHSERSVRPISDGTDRATHSTANHFPHRLLVLLVER